MQRSTTIPVAARRHGQPQAGQRHPWPHVGNGELRRLADTLSEAIGPGDELARVGGDEFAILTEAGVPEAGALCARLRAELAAEDIGITFGWAALPEDGLGPLELFRKADDRLYAAKLIQRNHRVVEPLSFLRASGRGVSLSSALLLVVRLMDGQLA
jgi:Diguanylate cyclase, GGDEF domain